MKQKTENSKISKKHWFGPVDNGNMHNMGIWRENFAKLTV